jgi:hypothetical protein
MGHPDLCRRPGDDRCAGQLAHCRVHARLGPRRDGHRVRLRGRRERRGHQDRRGRLGLRRLASRVPGLALSRRAGGRDSRRLQRRVQRPPWHARRRHHRREPRRRRRRAEHAWRGLQRGPLRRQHGQDRRRQLRAAAARRFGGHHGRQPAHRRCLPCGQRAGRAHHQHELGQSAGRRAVQHPRAAARRQRLLRGQQHLDPGRVRCREDRHADGVQRGQRRLAQSEPAGGGAVLQPRARKELARGFRAEQYRAELQRRRLHQRAGHAALQQVRRGEVDLRHGAGPPDQRHRAGRRLRVACRARRWPRHTRRGRSRSSWSASAT